MLLAAAAFAAEIDVRVVEYGTGLPVASADVRVDGDVVRVGDDGRARLPADRGTWTVSAPDFETLVVDPAPIVRLRREVAVEVVVQAPAPGEPSEDVLTADELRRVPGAFGDPVRALQSMPSVTRVSDLAGDVVVRGAEPVNTAAYVDGIRVPFLYHLLVGRSIVSPDLLGEIDFFPGAAPLRYTNVAQSVVDARFRIDPVAPGLHGRFHLDAIDTGASLQVRLSPSSDLRIAGRFGWLPTLGTGALALVQTAGAAADTPEVRFPTGDASFRLDHRAGADTWSLTALGAADALRYVGADFPTEEKEHEAIDEAGYDLFELYEAGFARVRGRWDRAVDGRTRAAWITAGGDVQQNLIPGLGVLSGTGSQDGRLEQISISAGFSGEDGADRPVGLVFGAEVDALPSRWTSYAADPDVGGDPTLARTTFREWLAAPWLGVPVRAGRLEVEPGVRISLFEPRQTWYLTPEPRVRARCALGERWALVGFLGQTAQAPAATEIAQGGADRPTRAIQAVLGAEARWSDLSLDVGAYHTWLSDLAVRDVGHVMVEQGNDPRYLSTDLGFSVLHSEPVVLDATGRAYGVEALLRYRPHGDSFGWLSAAVGRSFRSADGVTWPADADVPVSVTALYGLGLPHGFAASARAQVASGQPYTPELGVDTLGFGLLSYTALDGGWDGLSLDRNSARFPVYRRLDLRFEKAWTARRATWTAYLDVFNATNQHNPLWAEYDAEYQQLVTSAYVPILPSLGVEVEY